MRAPLRKAGYWLALGLVGGVLALVGFHSFTWIGEIPGALMAGVGMLCAALGLMLGPMSLLAAIGHARLLAGRGVIARWQVTPAEWDRFRAFDAARTAQDASLINDLRIRKATPEAGVDVIVGRKQLMVDGSYHVLRPFGLPELRAVRWLPAPADPECLEFTLAYPRGRYGGIRLCSLRVPVAFSARPAGVRVFEHFRALIPQRKLGIAFRRPGLVIGWGLGVMLACLAAAGVGWLLETRATGGDLAAILMLSGILGAGGSLFFTVVIALAVQPWKR